MERSRPKEQDAANRMSKFVLVRILWLVQNRQFWTYGRVLLLQLLRKLWFLITQKLFFVARWNLVCPFSMAVPRDVFEHFLKFLIFADFSPIFTVFHCFFHGKHLYSLVFINLKPFLQQPCPKERVTENRMSKFQIVHVLWPIF